VKIAGQSFPTHTLWKVSQTQQPVLKLVKIRVGTTRAVMVLIGIRA